ncbi:MAG TPA: hypothetical protein PK006_13355 [Saprospiraceae bacterium]|nr:hypothetical protein [Saprospiraceae bacterium]
MDFKELQSRIKASGKKLGHFLKEAGIPIHQYYYHKRKTDQTKNKDNYDFVQIKESDKAFVGELTNFQIDQIVIEYKNGVKLHVQSPLTLEGLKKMIQLEI